MNRLIIYIFIIVNTTFLNGYSQNPDSLVRVLNSSTDSVQLQTLVKLAELYSDSDSAKCWYYLTELEKKAKANEANFFKGKTFQLKGMFFKNRGNLNSAIDFFNDAGHIFQENSFLIDLGGIYNNLGATYADKGEYEKAIGYLLKALRIYDRFHDDKMKSKLLLNIGLVFYYQKNYSLALNYYSQSLSLRNKLNDKKGIALVYNNMGIVYYFMKDNKAAVTNFKKSLQINSALFNKRAMSLPLFNIAEIYFDQKQYDSAQLYYLKSYSIDTSLKDKASCTKSLIKLSACYSEQNNYSKALATAKVAEQLALEVDSKEDIKDAYQTLEEIYSDLKDYPRALKYSELSSNMKDSLFSKQSSELIAELQTKYETEKKDLMLGKQKETIQNQKLVSRILIVGILIALLFIAIVLVQYIQKKNAYKVLEEQKRNITDSINYASRIQAAMLPPVELLNKLLPNHFVLYMPRDIVSGDFYWITVAENRTILAVADCTGHGVPGAFMSMLGFAFLNEIVSKVPNISAHEILNELRRKIKSSLHQGENSSSKDGMDIALIIIDQKKKNLQFAGANNPILLCRNGNITSLPPDKMPIGIHSIEKDSFSLKEMELMPGDLVYLFSDGYHDQFGGEKMKKLGRVNFENLLLEASKLNIKAQKYFLEEKILEWMNSMDQMDDILVMGISV